MKYVNPEMEIVEFDASVLTLGLSTQEQDTNESDSIGGSENDNVDKIPSW